MNELIPNLLLPFETPTIFVAGFTLNILIGLVLSGLILLMYFGVRARRVWIKLSALGVGILVISMLSISHMEQLSHPKPLGLKWLKAQGKDGLTLLAPPIVRAPKAIDLLVELDGKSRLFSIPWSEKLEQSLKRALEEHNKRGSRGRLMLRFEPSEEKEQFSFHFMPWPAPPPKEEIPRQEPYRL